MPVDAKHKAIMEAKEYRIYEPCQIGYEVDFTGPVNMGKFSEVTGVTSIGAFVRVGMGCFISDAVIGDYVFMAPGVKICHDPGEFPSGGAGWKKTIIKDGARIGAGAIILGGLTIGENAVIGAGAVVTKDVPDGEKWVGNPARRVE